MSRVDNFDALTERVCLRGSLVTRTGLRIGSGGSGEFDAVDLPVLRDAQRYPLIPGSSIKGVLRSTVESILRGASLERSKHLWACNPHSEGRDGKDDGPASCGHHSFAERPSADTSGYCAACRLFGSRRVASHVRFTDALIPKNKRGGRIPVETRDGVAIDRDLRVVSGPAKYDFEVVSPGTQFDLEVFVENPEGWLMGLLIVGFDQIADGFSALGGFTSRGLGRVEIAWSEVERVRAKDLLAGLPSEKLHGDSLSAEFQAWRKQLAAHAGYVGGA